MTEADRALYPGPIVYAALHEIDGDPNNVRQSLPNIGPLACSIGQFGLLENLVAVRIPEAERADPEVWLQLRAGSRRFEAIRQLAQGGVEDSDGKRWEWPEDKPIAVLILDSDGVWEHIVENVQRSDLKPWDVGRRLSEMADGGTDYREIATRIGRSAGWVGRHITIGKGLHAKTIAHIEGRRMQPTLGVLQRLAAIKDTFGDPDDAAQIEALQTVHKRAPKKKMDASSIEALHRRVRYMEADMPVPPILRPCVAAIIDYLKGGATPNFRRLQRQFLDTQRQALEDD